MKAIFVERLTVEDPDTGNPVEIDVFKHENGGMFAVDTSYIDAQDTDEDDTDLGSLCVPSPFRDGLVELGYGG